MGLMDGFWWLGKKLTDDLISLAMVGILLLFIWLLNRR
jgi:hypothetical protein